MSDNHPVDAETVRGRGSRGVIATGAGVGLWVVNGLLHFPIVGLVIAGGLVALGIKGLTDKNRTDKATGGILMGAGALGLASFFLPKLTAFLFGMSGLALVGYGIYNLVKFAQGVKSRS
ncbi:MAG: hypothetical protein NT080_05745 [Spirochaetes bacterium]|nr:hypothetical protein [Spirochaetota bacterium]